MPGPHWNYQVNQAGSDIDDCRRKLDYLLKGDGDSDGSAAEVFRSGNTVVEIAIKTKKDRRGGEERKRCEEDKNQWVRTPEKKLVKRTTVVERLTEAEADKRGMKWGKSLATGQIPPRPSSKSSRRSRSTGEGDKGSSEDRRGLELRSARILLRQLRSALEARNEGKKSDPAAVESLLDDVEFVLAGRTTKEKVADSALATGSAFKSVVSSSGKGSANKSIDSLRTKGEVEKTRVDLKESQEKCAEKDKLISDLKQALDRLTTNNNDMVELLEGKVSLEENLARVQEENLALSKTLTANKALLSSMATELAKKEKENAKLRRLISEMQTTLNMDLERYAAKRLANPTPSPNQLLPAPSLGAVASASDSSLLQLRGGDAADGGRKAKRTSPLEGDVSSIISSTSDDSAIEDISRSNPSSKSTPPVQASGDQQNQEGQPQATLAPKPTEAIISDARSILGKLQSSTRVQKNQQPSHTFKNASQEKAVDTYGTREPHVTVAAKDSGPSSKEFDSLENNLQNFLHRMRNRPVLDVTVPDLPASRSFHSVFTATSGDETAATANATDKEEVSFVAAGAGGATLDQGTLSETKFRQGLEASLFFTSEDENATAVAKKGLSD